MNNKERLEIGVEAAIKAGVAILNIYDNEDLGVSAKEDESPLTLADVASNDIINSFLVGTSTPIISEENKEIAYDDRKDWNDCWIVDPLDGTKEFIKRNGEFTVNIAYVVKGVPELGIIYVPVSRELYYADVTKSQAFKAVLSESHELQESLFSEGHRISSKQELNGILRVVGSRSHMNQDTQDFVDDLAKNDTEVEIVSKGSSLKFCMVAEGKADFYPRFAPTMEWDTAAGHAICNAAGLKVIAQDTQSPLLYNKKNLLNPYFLVSN